MKLILATPEYDSGRQIVLEKLFYEWFWYHNIYIGKPGTDFYLEYNSFYKFYKLSLFKISGDEDHWQDVLDFLKKNCYRVEDGGSTWRWENKKQVRGKVVLMYE